MTESQPPKAEKTDQEIKGAHGQVAPVQTPLKAKVQLPTGSIHEIEFSPRLTVKEFCRELSETFAINGWELAVLSSTGQFKIVYGEDDRSAGHTEVAALTADPNFDHFILAYPIVCA
jgi:hypothetical protein